MQTKNSYIIVILLLFIISCNNKSASNSSVAIIPSSKMVEILTDVHLVEAALKQKQERGANMNFYTPFYYKNIFIKHGINQQQFRKSLQYYLQKPDKFEKIYYEVITSLTEIQNKEQAK